jgi:hypothetical protein
MLTGKLLKWVVSVAIIERRSQLPILALNSLTKERLAKYRIMIRMDSLEAETTDNYIKMISRLSINWFTRGAPNIHAVHYDCDCS